MKQPIIKILTRYTLYATRFFLIIAAIFFYTINQTMAIDPPHSTVQSVQCNSCHSAHKASGTSLTNNASNANLCFSCHNVAGLASSKTLTASMQATPGTEGTSHRWDGMMPSVDSPDNVYGLRPSASLTNFKTQLTSFGNVVTCSVCHMAHGQAKTSWDPNAPAYTGAGTGSGRHFQRISNDINQMCEDCHYYRKAGTTGTNVRIYDGNKKSHPVVKIFTSGAGRDVSDSTQFNDAPLEPDYAGWVAQTGARYHINGGSDNNVTNNIVVDSSKQTRCLSCHGIHYTDSSAGTIDGP